MIPSGRNKVTFPYGSKESLPVRAGIFKRVRFGLVGCGAMGTVIVRHTLKRWGHKTQWTGLHDLRVENADSLRKKCKMHAPTRGLPQLVGGADWIVEAASPQAVPDVLKLCVAKGKNLLVMSTGGLLVCSGLLKKAAQKGIKVIIPSGAIAGLDAIKAARLGRISQAKITTRKPPKALEGAPYLMKKGLRMSDVTVETVIFEGNASQAMDGFPANINVAATLALATGLGPAKTRVKIVADPTITRNIHQIQVTGSTGRLTATVENVPSAVNPKTSELAVLAACAAIDEIFLAVRIGT